MTIMENVNTLIADKDFLAQIAKCDTKEELQALLASKDIEMTLEEIDEVLEAASQAKDGELNEDSLDNVVGGVAAVCTILLCSAFTTFGASLGRLYSAVADKFIKG